MGRNNINVVLSATDRASKTINKVGISIKGIAAQAVAFGLGQAGMYGMGAAIEKAGKALVGYNARMQESAVAMETMLGSAEKAQSFLGEMQEFAATTPFQFREVDEAAKKFLAFGWNVEAVLPGLTAVGDAAAALGIGGEGINRITLALGQMSIKAKVSGQEIRQLNEAGIGAQKYLADAFNLTADAFDNLAKTGINGVQAVNAIVNGMLADDKFQKMMEVKSEMLTGMWSTVKDNTSLIFGAIGNKTTGFVTDMVRSLRDLTSEFADVIRAGGSVYDSIIGLFPEEWASRIERYAAVCRQFYARVFPALSSVGDLLGVVGRVAGGVIDALMPVFPVVGELMAVVIEDISWALGEIARIANKIIDTVIEAMEKIPRAWNRIVNSMKGLANKISANRDLGLVYEPTEYVGPERIPEVLPNDHALPPKPEKEKKRPIFDLDMESLTAGLDKAAAKAAAKLDKINADLVDKAKRATLDRYEYEAWALAKEVEDLEKAGADKAKIRGYYEARSAEIAADAADARKKVLDREAAEATRAAESLAKTRAGLEEQLMRALADTGQMTEREYQLWRIDDWVTTETAKWPQLTEEIQKTAAALKAVVNQKYPSGGMPFTDAWMSGIKDAYKDMSDWGANTAEAAKQTAEAMQGAFSDLFFDSMKGEFKSLGEYATSFFNGMARAISNLLANAMAVKIMGALFPGLTLEAKGDVFSRGRVTPFAKGGINPGIPQLFPMANGMGLWGEAGPEVIMPIKRTPDGRMGVAATGGGGAPPVQINVINQTGQQVKAKQNPPRFDGQRWVVDMFLGALADDVGGLRTAMQGGRP